MKKHQVVLNYFEKAFTWLDDKGETVTVKGIPRKNYVRYISALQMKKSIQKGSKVFDVHVMNDKHMNKEDKLIRWYPNLKIIFICFPGRDSKITSKKRIGFYYWISTRRCT